MLDRPVLISWSRPEADDESEQYIPSLERSLFRIGHFDSGSKARLNSMTKHRLRCFMSAPFTQHLLVAGDPNSFKCD